MLVQRGWLGQAFHRGLEDFDCDHGLTVRVVSGSREVDRRSPDR
jgi:hypothetical protein